MNSKRNDLMEESDWLSENDAHRVLARAVELDARSNTNVPVSQLREIAGEAGIDRSAFETALGELRSGKLPALSQPAMPQSQSLTMFLSRHRRHAVVIALVTASFTTPGDMLVPTSLLALKLYGLYEFGILVSRFIDSARGRMRSRVPDAAEANIRDSDGSARHSSNVARSLVLHRA